MSGAGGAVMNFLTSTLDKKRYLNELKRCCSYGYPFFREGVSGIVIGPFFSVAYYSPYEWNRRISHECNRAWGYVKEVDGRTHVHYIRGKGMLTPFWVLLLTLICYLIFMIGLDFDFSILLHPGILLFVPGIVLAICVGTALGSTVTDAGIAGEQEIIRMLVNPKDYYC